jgi:hypothetical protein
MHHRGGVYSLCDIPFKAFDSRLAVQCEALFLGSKFPELVTL